MAVQPAPGFARRIPAPGQAAVRLAARPPVGTALTPQVAATASLFTLLSLFGIAHDTGSGRLLDDALVRANAVPLHDRGGTEYNVLACGVTDDGVDTTDALLELIAEAGPEATIVFPRPQTYYAVSASLTPLEGQTWRGQGWTHSTQAGAWIRGLFAGPIIDAPATLHNFTLDGLSFSGHASAAGSKGIHAADAQFWHVRNCKFHQFADQALHIEDGTGGIYENILATASLLNRAGRSAYVGVVDINADDVVLFAIESNASVTAVGDGFIAGLALRSTNGFAALCIGEISEAGIVLVTGAAQWSFVGNRADLNYGHGWILGGSESVFTGNRAYRNGRAANDTYDGFQINNHGHAFVGNIVGGLSGDGTKQRYGFLDQASGGGGEAYGNQYVANKAFQITRTTYFQASSNKVGFGQADRSLQRTITGATTLTYADQTVLCNAAGGAFTVTLPTAAGVTGKRFTLKRTSASNNVTVDGAGSETIDAAATKTLGAQHAAITIESDGTNWQIVNQLGTVT